MYSVKNNLIINIKVGGFTLTDFKKYYKSMLIKIAYCICKNKQRDKLNKIGKQKINLEIYN